MTVLFACMILVYIDNMALKKMIELYASGVVEYVYTLAAVMGIRGYLVDSYNDYNIM